MALKVEGTHVLNKKLGNSIHSFYLDNHCSGAAISKGTHIMIFSFVLQVRYREKESIIKSLLYRGDRRTVQYKNQVTIVNLEINDISHL